MSVKTASSSRATTGTVKVKTAISTPAKRHVSSGKKRTPVGTRKTVAQSKAKAIFIDLTLSSDSSDDDDETTAPRNTRRPSSTAVASSGSSISGSSSRSASRSDEDLQDEAMLERMLMRRADSDMDLGSSDVEDGETAMDLGSDEDEDEDDSDESDMDLGSENSYLRVYG